MKRFVLILEDDGGRIERFCAVVQKNWPKLQVVWWASAREMVDGVEKYLAEAAVVSLDHDLYAAGGADVGDGLEVARFLAGQEVRCPVVIHSSNAERSARMRGALEVEGWEVRMVAPFGTRWVEEYWSEIVRGIIASGSE